MADSKISALPTISTVDGDELVPLCDDPGGTPATKAITTSDLLDGLAALAGATFTGDVSVPDEAYGGGWNGSLEVPTKNAVYDKIETVVAGSGGGALVAIATTTLASPAASIAFSSIAGSYRNLRVVLVARGSVASTAANMLLTFNGDTGSNYDYQRLVAAATSVSTAQSFAQTSIRCGFVTGASSPANSFTTTVVEIAAYAGSTHKGCLSRSAGRYDTSQYQAEMFGGSWRSTSAITSVTFTPSSGNFDTGTTAVLYGEDD